MTDYLIAGGRLVDPATGRDEVTDVLIRSGRIESLGRGLPADGAEVVDASGQVVAPGLVDLHTHVREPGREDEETIATASAAAAAGGYTAITAMPNTDPVADNAAVTEKVWALGQAAGLVRVVPAGAVSKGLEGARMADIGAMATSVAGVTLFTDDGQGVQSSLLARRAMEYIAGFGGVYAEHCEDDALAAGGQMNEGPRSHALGLRGIPAAAEELMAARDVALCRLTGCRLHLLHVSAAGTVDIVRRAKEQGLPITAEATPHHFTLTDEVLEAYDPLMKVNPPLRSEEDRVALIEGLADGTIDVIATDHAPHALEEKDCEFELAPPGMLGLETALALTLTELVEPGHLSLGRALHCLASAPAGILGLDGHGRVAEGGDANLVVLDPGARWVVNSAELHSLTSNTPFAGRELAGLVTHVFLGEVKTVSGGRVAEALPA